VRAILFCLLFIFFGLLQTSCFVRTNRVSFRGQLPLVSKYADLRKDSIRFILRIVPDKRNMVIPLVIFKSNKAKASIQYSLHGKGISAREYRVNYRTLLIYRDTTVIGKSTDTALFTEQVAKPVPGDLISPIYGTKYLLNLPNANTATLRVRIEFELQNKQGLKEDFIFDRPLEKIPQKSFTLFNPFN